MNDLARILLVYLSLNASPLWACSFDGVFTNPFTESYAGSFDVALATQKVVQDGSINKPVKLEGMRGLQQSTWWLKIFAKKQSNELVKGTYIYLIDSHLWAKALGDQKLKVHVPKPSKPDAVLVLSGAALASLVSEDINYQQALDMGIAKLIAQTD